MSEACIEARPAACLPGSVSTGPARPPFKNTGNSGRLSHEIGRLGRDRAPPPGDERRGLRGPTPPRLSTPPRAPHAPPVRGRGRG
eukprot:scaffold2377_cov74-Phaeocystis_antarctica.AAC.1